MTGRLDRQNDNRVSHRILVVDDDPENRLLATDILDDSFEVYSAGTGKEGLDKALHGDWNLIMIDVTLPEIDGFDLMHRIMNDPANADTSIVMITDDDNRELEIRGIEEGATDFIRKPYEPKVLFQRIRHILEYQDLRENLHTEIARQTMLAELRRQKVEHLSDQIIDALAEAVDAKDQYTNGHSRRVARYAKEIARRMGKTPDEQEYIEYMGKLHDIGKIGIPDAIINKRSRLTEEEYQEIQKHPEIGAKILEKISDIPGLAVGAHWHHERYDGSGYPDGIRGKDIPEEARIIGICDAYDAMTSKRTYTTIRPQAEVRAEIVRGIGTQFDPDLALIMLQMIDEDTNYEMKQNI